MQMPDKNASTQNAVVRTSGRQAGRAARVAMSVAVACSGCGWMSSFRAPKKLGGVGGATPLPPTCSVPPVEPPAAAPVVTATPPVLPFDPPTKALLDEFPSMPLRHDDSIADAKREVEKLKTELSALKTQQASSQSALESLTASSLASASRSAALEAHIALQASLIDDLRTASTQQQHEQWKALDAVSEAIERMLKKEPQAEPSRPVPPTVAPGRMPLEEIISRGPSESTQGATR